MKFNKETIRKHHLDKVNEILDQHDKERAAQHIVDYLMYRVGAVIRSERLNCAEQIEEIKHDATRQGGNNEEDSRDHNR